MSFLIAGKVQASPDLILDGTSVSLSGTLHYRYVRLLDGARITVAPYDGQPGTTTGRLEVIATDILVDATSEIDATAAGFRGLVNKDGEGLAGGRGALVSTDATGGGGHAGKGGDGVLLAGCAPIAGAAGGVALTGSLTDVTFGSAGAAAGTADGDNGGRGGTGGGAIVLRAGRVEVSGKVTADGEGGGVFADDSSGGGAGGGVLVQAAYFLSFGGQLSVAGAPGGSATDDEGGAGGGGRILLIVPALPSDLHIIVEGGTAGCSAAAGGVGQAKLIASAGCLDLDEDGVPSAGCGGLDCDDSDPNVRPGVAEECNGQDDDCSGAVDDHGASQSCGGAPCTAGVCEGKDAGADAPQDVVDPADAAEDAEDAADTEPDTLADAPDAGDGDLGDADEREAATEEAPARSEPDLVMRGGCRASRGGLSGSAWGAWAAGMAFVFELRRRRRLGSRRSAAEHSVVQGVSGPQLDRRSG